MTNKECIEILKTIELRLDLDVIEDGEDAINTAIQALEKQEIYVVKIYEICGGVDIRIYPYWKKEDAEYMVIDYYKMKKLPYGDNTYISTDGDYAEIQTIKIE